MVITFELSTGRLEMEDHYSIENSDSSQFLLIAMVDAPIFKTAAKYYVVLHHLEMFPLYAPFSASRQAVCLCILAEKMCKQIPYEHTLSLELKLIPAHVKSLDNDKVKTLCGTPVYCSPKQVPDE